jgi:hypothetical protein
MAAGEIGLRRRRNRGKAGDDPLILYTDRGKFAPKKSIIMAKTLPI